MTTNISPDLVWEATRTYNAFMVKRKTAGGAEFSRDPLNLLNKHSKKYEGYCNEKAIGISPGENGGVLMTTKKKGKENKPAQQLEKRTYGGNTGTRKTYRSIVNATTRKSYRPDLRASAVARAAAVRMSQMSPKKAPAAKLRGARAKARAAAMNETN